MEERDAELEELMKTLSGYEKEVAEKRSCTKEKEEEMEKLRQLICGMEQKMERDKKELKKRFEEEHKIAEGLENKLREKRGGRWGKND